VASLESNAKLIGDVAVWGDRPRYLDLSQANLLRFDAWIS
jgi:hypothetical protein